MGCQKKYLQLLLKVFDEIPLYVTKNNPHNQFRPGKQKFYTTSLNTVVDHRCINSNEVVIDLDAPSYLQNYKYAKKIIDYLDSASIPYYPFWTGGKGIHIHIFLDIDIGKEVQSMVLELMKNEVNVMQEIRLQLLDDIMAMSGIPKDLIGMGKGKIVDTQKLRWNDMKEKRTLIRICGGGNFKKNKMGDLVKSWKTYFEILPGKKPQKNTFFEVEYPEKIELYKVDEGFLIDIFSEKLKLIRALKKANHVQYSGKYLNLPCVQRIREGLSEGVRHCGSKVLAIACRLDALSLSEALAAHKQYVQSCTPQYDRDESIGWAKWINSQAEVYWACGHCKNLDVCSPEGCQLNIDKHAKDLDNLKEGKLLEKVKRVLDEVIIGEKDNKMLLFLIFCTPFVYESEDGSPPASVMIEGSSSAGKTHMMKEVANLFGEEGEEWFFLSRMSKTALDYMADPDKWKKRIVIFQELQGCKEVLESLRLVISDGILKSQIAEETIIDGVKTHITVEKVKRFPSTLFAMCNAEDDDEGDQMKNRSWCINPDESFEQTKKIMDKELIRIENREKQTEFNFERQRFVEEIRSAISFIRDLEIEVQVPFRKEINLLFPFKNEIRMRRDIYKFTSLIQVVSLLNMQSREIKVKKSGQKYIIATKEDVLIAIKYAFPILEAASKGLKIKEVEAYDLINASLAKGLGGNGTFTVKDFQGWSRYSQSFSNRILKALEEKGYLSKYNDGGNYNPLNIYELTDKSPNYLDNVEALFNVRTTLEQKGGSNVGKEK